MSPRKRPRRVFSEAECGQTRWRWVSGRCDLSWLHVCGRVTWYHGINVVLIDDHCLSLLWGHTGRNRGGIFGNGKRKPKAMIQLWYGSYTPMSHNWIYKLGCCLPCVKVASLKSTPSMNRWSKYSLLLPWNTGIMYCHLSQVTLWHSSADTHWLQDLWDQRLWCWGNKTPDRVKIRV